MEKKSMKEKVWELVLEIVDERYDPIVEDHKYALEDIVSCISDLASAVEDKCDKRADYERECKKDWHIKGAKRRD